MGELSGCQKNDEPMKKALITGANGQDGSYLSELLISLGYDVHGIVRRNSVPEHQESRLAHIGDKIKTYYGDVTDPSSIEDIMRRVMPDEIYNLAAQSHVRISSDIPVFTANVNAIGVLNMLEAYRKICPTAKFYQASSSEMFGSSVDPDGFQRETTRMTPVSPYGCAKVFGYNIVRHYRAAYGLHACNGILFNHESPRRGSNFVTSKVIRGAIECKLGIKDKLEMGNMLSKRDWGHSKDYVRAMHMIINHPIPDDFVVATGETRSVEDLCKYVFRSLDLNWVDYIEFNQKFLRPQELEFLRGDSSKIRSVLGWKPEYTFESMIDEMIGHWKGIIKK